MMMTTLYDHKRMSKEKHKYFECRKYFGCFHKLTT